MSFACLQLVDRPLDLLGSLRQSFQDVGHTGTLATFVFRISDVLGPLRQSLQGFGPSSTEAPPQVGPGLGCLKKLTY